MNWLWLRTFWLCAVALLAGAQLLRRDMRRLEVKAQECFEAGLPKSISRARFPLCKVLNKGKVVMYWTHDGDARHNGQAENVTVAVVAKTSSDWVAVGFSQANGGMNGLDIAMLRKHKDGSFVLEDRFADGHDVPLLDQYQDKALLFAESHPDLNLVAFGFSMPVRGRCKDTRDADLNTAMWVYVRWAWGDEDEDGQPAYHGAEGKGGDDVDMFQPTPMPTTHDTDVQGAGKAQPQTDTGKAAAQDLDPDLPPGAKTLTVQLPEVVVYGNQTQYTCMFYEPPSDQKYHIYGIDYFGGGNGVKVHHTYFYQTDTLSRELGVPYDCYRVDSLASYNLRPIFPEFPAATRQLDAAHPFGKGYPRYWVLEVHFESFQTEAVTSTAGVKLTYSAALATHDIGHLLVAPIQTSDHDNFTSGLTIPPGKQSFDSVWYCPAACTKLLLPPEGVSVVGVFMDLHMLGTQSEVQIIRGAGSLPPNSTEPLRREVLVRYDHYDTWLVQSQTMRAASVRLMPGDGLLVRCTYNSTGRTEETPAGQGVKEETCVGSIAFYPAAKSLLLTCQDVYGARGQYFDDVTALNGGVPVEAALCATVDQLEELAASDDRTQAVLDMGLFQGVTQQELRAKAEWGTQQRAACPAA